MDVSEALVFVKKEDDDFSPGKSWNAYQLEDGMHIRVPNHKPMFRGHFLFRFSSAALAMEV